MYTPTTEMPKQKTAYQILELDEEAFFSLSLEQRKKILKDQHHTMIFKYHTDRNKSPEANEKSQQINNARDEILKDIENPPIRFSTTFFPGTKYPVSKHKIKIHEMTEKANKALRQDYKNNIVTVFNNHENLFLHHYSQPSYQKYTATIQQQNEQKKADLQGDLAQQKKAAFTTKRKIALGLSIIGIVTIVFVPFILKKVSADKKKIEKNYWQKNLHPIQPQTEWLQHHASGQAFAASWHNGEKHKYCDNFAATLVGSNKEEIHAIMQDLGEEINNNVSGTVLKTQEIYHKHLDHNFSIRNQAFAYKGTQHSTEGMIHQAEQSLVVDLQGKTYAQAWASSASANTNDYNNQTSRPNAGH